MIARVSPEAQLDAAQSAALAHPLEGGSLALVGPAGTGKSVALTRRAQRILAAGSGGTVLVTAPSGGGIARLRARLALDGTAAALDCRPFAEVALQLLAQAAGSVAPPELIDDVRAAQHFQRAGASLFALEWTEFVSAEIDPEITGLRAPERFSAAAFRLIRKLRASLLSPEHFKTLSLRGATSFFGHPPNLSGADLLLETPAKYRESLRVSSDELQRQHAREIDLIHILTRLYESYVGTLVAGGCLTSIDAVYEATMLLRAQPELRTRAREHFRAACVDDAQDLTPGEVGLLQCIFGEELQGITLAGDVQQSTRGFAGGGRGVETLKLASTTIAFETRYRCDPEIERAALRGLGAARGSDHRVVAPASRAPAVEYYRADNMRDEARFAATEIERLLGTGIAPASIALITRNLGCAHTYIDALLARNIPVDVAGAANLFAFPATLDALAALWAAVDPFRHDYILRNLEAPWLRLGDASIASLCGEPASAEALLFEIPGDDPDEARAGRWDRRRDLRLGRNLTRGDVDADLTAEARARVVDFRAARRRWEDAARALRLGELSALILDETVFATLARGARGRFEAGLARRLQEQIDAYERRDPLASLDDFLAYAENVMDTAADLLALHPFDGEAVRVLDVEAAKGEEFDTVFVVDVRAGAWPRYYVPDAFLFTPSLGMLPKENVGDSRTTRTAKFTYALFRSKVKDKYNAEERRAFYCAATRARRRLYLSAAGRPTRGASTPEILEELMR